MSNKCELSFKEIISKYHPKFKNLGERAIKLYNEISEYLKVEKLVEETVAYRHMELAKSKNQNISYTHIPEGHGQDLSDRSDVKFVSISCSWNKTKGCEQRAVAITVKSPSGEPKLGALRVVLYNYISQQLEYYFFPKNVWVKWTNFTAKMMFSCPASGVIRKIQKYRLGSFDELCMMTDEKMDEEIIKAQPSLVQYFT